MCCVHGRKGEEVSLFGNLSLGVGCPGFVSVDFCNGKIAETAALCGRRGVVLIVLACLVLAEGVGAVFESEDSWYKYVKWAMLPLKALLLAVALMQ